VGGILTCFNQKYGCISVIMPVPDGNLEQNGTENDN